MATVQHLRDEIIRIIGRDAGVAFLMPPSAEQAVNRAAGNAKSAYALMDNLKALRAAVPDDAQLRTLMLNTEFVDTFANRSAREFRSPVFADASQLANIILKHEPATNVAENAAQRSMAAAATTRAARRVPLAKPLLPSVPSLTGANPELAVTRTYTRMMNNRLTGPVIIVGGGLLALLGLRDATRVNDQPQLQVALRPATLPETPQIGIPSQKMAFGPSIQNANMLAGERQYEGMMIDPSRVLAAGNRR